MTLGCGSWGGNVTSDNISPLHLMDIKRIAYETRPVTDERSLPLPVTAENQTAAPAPARKASMESPLPIDRAEIAALVDKFLKGRSTASPVEVPVAAPTENGRAKAVEFVCEEDVRQALKAGAKIHVNAKTIVTPAARELGDTRDVFAKA